VNGARLASTLSKPTLGAILDRAGDVMRDALDQGGTSFDSMYVNVNGESGYFERSLDAYGREGEPCGRCGAVMRREKFMNRSSYYCPKCQPRPRR
jgi:formamidopyrimidine-DNA glycosylase